MERKILLAVTLAHKNGDMSNQRQMFITITKLPLIYMTKNTTLRQKYYSRKNITWAKSNCITQNVLNLTKYSDGRFRWYLNSEDCSERMKQKKSFLIPSIILLGIYAAARIRQGLTVKVIFPILNNPCLSF